ncbi:Sulfotransferase [Trinorchestia longiramus]|nr:Sulfotransferase [Trinorchestia longiramus]
MKVTDDALGYCKRLVSLLTRLVTRVVVSKFLPKALTYVVSAALLLLLIASNQGTYLSENVDEVAAQEPEYYDIISKNAAIFHNRTDEAIRKGFKRRNEMIKELCRSKISNKTISLPINSREFLINDKRQLVWCNIFKSASTNWFHLFLKLAGLDPERQKTSLVQAAREKVYPRPSLKKLKLVLNDLSYTSFVVLREPFERILSSYEHVAGSTDTPYYHKMRCKMTQNVRTRTGNCNPTFPQYVDFIIAEAAAGHHMDEHWHPYTSFCSLCQVNYTYVMKFEYMEEEQRFLAHKIPRLAEAEQLHRNPSHRNYSEYIPKFYGQLTRPQLDSLLNIYMEDFLLSGHSWSKYYQYVKRV